MGNCELFNELFYYDGVSLRNKIDRPPNAKKDNTSGSITNEGYVYVQIKRKGYMAHRVIWEMLNGEIPNGMQIDHINHNRSDNRLKNLRITHHKGNGRNQSKSILNTSGVTGVRLIKNTNKWQASIGVDGKLIYLGVYEKMSDAIKARRKAEAKYGFHENHGMNP